MKRFAWILLSSLLPVLAHASETGVRIADCIERDNPKVTYDFYEVEVANSPSKFYATMGGDGTNILVGPAEKANFLDGRKSLGLQFGPVSFVIYKGERTIGKMAAYGDVTEIACNANWSAN